jgi:hypothetical protein
VPRLVLLEDDGREVFSGDISRPNYEALLRLFHPHRAAIKTAAAVVRTVRELLAAVPPPPRPRVAAPRGKRGRVGRA